MKKLIILLIVFSSCSSTERMITKSLSKKPAYQVRDNEAKKFSRDKIRPAELVQISLFVFLCASVTDYAYKNDLLKRK